MPMANSRKWLSLCLLSGLSANAYSAADELALCAGIADDRKRLACFDDMVAKRRAEAPREPVQAAETDAASSPSAPIGGNVTPAVPSEPPEKSWLATHWELGPENKRGTFKFQPHMANYLIATYTDSPNSEPYRPFRPFVARDIEISKAELSFQIGFKMKMAENLMDSPADLWFGYTQLSFWQAANREASSPFRETDYQPELMTVLPLNVNLLGMKARFINFGLVHQSNGQSSTLSRSWNRLYAQLGLENGDFTLLARVWHRFAENAAEDDNPDIIDYMGRGDLVATYRWRGHEFSALARYNFDTRRGAAELGWAFPIEKRLKGYVQFFSGYGHSLIDYKHPQNTLGLGVLVSY
ncbi:hypothetical protein EGT07_11180 [Herbaspirillum sp. HC18]|nr:hypothetical protein EGT07_11180 [Herbaspirillum sp. HC18]